MLSARSLSKRREKSIILVHGLFTGSEYWLRYLSYFSEYNVVLIHVEYQKLLELETQMNEFSSELRILLRGKEVVGILGHSLGCLISDMIAQRHDYLNIQICPVQFAVRKNLEGFVASILLKNSKHRESDIIELLESVNAYLKRFSFTERDNTSGVRKILLPLDDEYFDYFLDIKGFDSFQGDHFDIRHAVELIRDKYLPPSMRGL